MALSITSDFTIRTEMYQYLCDKYKVDRIIAEPDFAVKDGYIVTAFKGDKYTISRVANPSREALEQVLQTMSKELKARQA